MTFFSPLKNVRLAGVFLLLASSALLLLSGCAAPPKLSAAAKARLPNQSFVTGVPFYSQQDYQCGPASLAMALGASGQSVSVDTLIPQVFLPGREGSVQPEMLAAVRRHQRISFTLDGSFDALLTEVEAGNPVVVLQNLGLSFAPLWHYAVVIGFDQARQQLLLHSGEHSRQVTSMSRFNATWARSQHWAMVALAPGEFPASVTPSHAADAVSAYEQAAGSQAALPAWQAFTQQWPDNALGWFALGNALHAEQDYDAAANAFNQATLVDASLAPAWLNLGLTQQGLGQMANAQKSLRHAAALPGKWQTQAQQALANIEL
ncbi:PA2778 family cysteine peptidase [Oceanisphaera avium]|uniref:Peptidase C39-like domain-containing protein n=1 Tax=Oceanisphaera avium TaxID=1903694 RepID=A0A1Y0D0W9_9GAMM|nr:PA2778 family cysteine peptidase [Oceanisphaera avium]ART80787.1 hypothetical protein CBP12_12000 [Oceanisphaera avium]